MNQTEVEYTKRWSEKRKPDTPEEEDDFNKKPYKVLAIQSISKNIAEVHGGFTKSENMHNPVEGTISIQATGQTGEYFTYGINKRQKTRN